MSFMVLYVHRNLWFIRDGGGGGGGGDALCPQEAYGLLGTGGEWDRE